MKIKRKDMSLREAHPAGFTMIELIIAIFVASVLFVMLLRVHDNIQNSSSQQIEFNMLQQNQRGVLAIMERELRMIGMDRNRSNVFGVTDLRRYDVTAPGTAAVPDNTGSPVLQFTIDMDDDMTVDANETITYLLYDRNGDGTVFDLARSETNAGANQVAGRQLLAEGVEALEFAFAFDADGNDEIDRAVLAAGEPPSIVWAIDSNNDGLLDADLLGTPLNTYAYADGRPFPATARPQDVRAVQVWILGRALRTDRKYVDQHQYSVGSRVLVPFNDHTRRWLLSEIIHCRNL